MVKTSKSTRVAQGAGQSGLASPGDASGLVCEAFEAVPHAAAIVDHRGVIVAVNRAWRESGARGGTTAAPDVGSSYLEACDRAAAARDGEAAQAAVEIRALLARGSGASSLARFSDSPERRRWFEARAVAFGTTRGNCVLVLHEELSAGQEARRALSANERMLREIIEALPIGLWIQDAAGRIVHGNPAGVRIWAGERLVGPEQFGEYKGWWVSTGEPIAPDDWAATRAIRRGEVSLDEEIEIECFDGTHKVILNSALPIRGDNGQIEGAIIVNVDVTETRKATAALRESEQRWRALFDLLPVGASILDGRNRIVEHNRALERILGLTPEEMEDGAYRDWRFFGPDGAALGEEQFPSVRARRTNRSVDPVEVTIERGDGSRISTSVSAAPLPRPSGGVVVVTNDITPQVRAVDSERRAKVELERALLEQTELARVDPLTRVSNRRHFYEMAEHELALADRHDYAISVVVLDLDHFKAVNDRYGHAGGDELLKDVARAMKMELRSTDVLARHGGEEFAVLLPHTESAAAGLVAEHLCAAISECRVAIDAGADEQTASAGVATARRAESIDSLVRRADEALYAAKSLGRNRVVVAADPPEPAS